MKEHLCGVFVRFAQLFASLSLSSQRGDRGEYSWAENTRTRKGVVVEECLFASLIYARPNYKGMYQGICQKSS
jgi:hypothetical protein